MDFELRATPADADTESLRSTAAASEFELSAAPLIASEPTPELAALPAEKGAPILCLMARDPHTLFAYWEIDWPGAFRDGEPAERKVHLRVLHADGSEQRVEVEPMAGSCYVTVDSADAAYSAEIGFYQPASVWNSVATSDLIRTPPDNVADEDENAFATVPFHLSFQQMIDMLRSSRGDDAPLLTQLADFRQRADAADASELTSEQRDLAAAINQADAAQPPAIASSDKVADVSTRQRLERILGFGATSPSGGFGGSSR